MKVKGFMRVAMAVCVLAVSVLVCAGVSVAAETPVGELPVVAQWVNGAAQGADGLYLHDTWAVDETGVDESKFVLVNQDGCEVFRVAQYPKDIEAGKTISVPQYAVTVQLTVPEGLTEEVLVTFGNGACSYTVSLTQENGYQGQCKVYPGEYQVSEVEVPAAADEADIVYALVEKSTFAVNGDGVSVPLEVQKSTVADGEADGNPDEGTGEEKGVDVIGTFQAFDSNGDLLNDTVWLIVWVIILFSVYGIIKYRRKKREELNR